MSIEEISAVWPEWTVAEQLGEGTYGKVFKATREAHGVVSSAAIKMVSIPQSDAELSSMRAEGLDESGTRSYFAGIVSDFVNEIKAMESLKGTTNIVSIEDYKVVEKADSIGWDIFIRMELLTPLNDYITDKKLSEAEVIKLGCDICQALELCAQRHIIHRDIKPENIFVSSFGDFKVGDFGVARELEKTGGSLSKKGTPNYMAPEIELSKDYDATVDIYSLGLVLYKLLNNNRLPFLDPYAQLITYQDRRTAIDRRSSGEVLPLPVEASPELAQIILTACAFDPTMRFQTPTAFKNALGSIVGAGSCPAPPPVSVSSLDETVSLRRAPQADNSVQTGIPVASFGKEKNSSSFIKLAISLTAVFLVIVIAGLIWLQRPGSDPVVDVMAALEAGEHSEALALVYELDDDAVQDELYDMLQERLDTILQEFMNEQMDHIIALAEIQVIESMRIQGLQSSITGAREEMNKIIASRIALELAEVNLAAGIYQTAIFNLDGVDLSDPNFGRAFEVMQLAMEGYRNETLERAEEAADTGNYLQAIRILEGGLFTLENDAVLRRQISFYQDIQEAAIRQGIFDNAAVFSADNDWVGGIQALNNGLFELPNDAQILERIRGYEDSYVAQAIGFSETLSAAGRYAEAVSILNSVLRTLPDDTRIHIELARIESIRPMTLGLLTLIDSANHSHEIGNRLTDSFGNEYNESHRLGGVSLWGSGARTGTVSSYAMFNLNRNFTAFSAYVVAPTGLDSDAVFTIEIHLNDELIPTLRVEDFNVRTGRTLIEVDVTGASTITITGILRDGSDHWNNSIHGAAIYLVDTLLIR